MAFADACLRYAASAGACLRYVASAGACLHRSSRVRSLPTCVAQILANAASWLRSGACEQPHARVQRFHGGGRGGVLSELMRVFRCVKGLRLESQGQAPFPFTRLRWRRPGCAGSFLPPVMSAERYGTAVALPAHWRARARARALLPQTQLRGPAEPKDSPALAPLLVS